MVLEEKTFFPRFPDFRFCSTPEIQNLGKCSFTSNFDSSCNLRRKRDKKLTELKNL